jgi:hypothetical protein
MATAWAKARNQMSKSVERESEMARRPKIANTTAMRLGEEAVRLSRIAAGFTKESMAEYITRITIERARSDIDSMYRDLKEEKPPKPPGPPAELRAAKKA